MEKLGLNEIREKFLSFYESKGHYRINSFSLVPPPEDKSLLIINSGMAPLKPYFAGTEVPPSKRVTTCQKCIRTGDIENVGLTARHGTFFEMLGNFSFGDYFKKESLTWGLEFVTEVLHMPFDKLWATVYEDDDEAVEIWKSLGMPAERIVRLGKDDNFWEIGLGPCGPCSEIYFDRGPEYGCGKADCKPGCDCDRYLEFWNHVFTQFSKEEDGSYSNLEHKNIDTGMGLERIACIMQGVDSIFDVDTIRAILDEVTKKAGIEYCDGKAKTDVSIRLITDHIRSVTFMISDGIMPSNEGRGYVLRRLLRRAARHGKLLGIEGSFMPELSKKVIEVSGKAYPALEEKKDYIYRILSIEEEKFASTIDQGTVIIGEYVEELKKQGKTELSGDKVFKLYDTYGFPLELTQEILSENGFTADVDGFNANMEKQKEQARAARKEGEEAGWKESVGEGLHLVPTEFCGYDSLSDQGTVLAVFVGNEPSESIGEGQSGRIFLDRTPLYAESGGQASDTGKIFGNGFEANVLEVTKLQNAFVHRIEVVEGTLRTGDTVTLQTNSARRHATARNHTATHLLHKALRIVLGEHVAQAGSSVTEDGLRFDFTHFEALTPEQLSQVEKIVNDEILAFLPVSTEVMSMDEAKEKGATALFGEKYGNQVRVVSVGDFSIELCGGTHVSNSGQIGALKILSENGVAAGVRRIEAITGLALLEMASSGETVVREASEILKTTPAALLQRIVVLNEELKAAKKELSELRKAGIDDVAAALMKEAVEINGVRLITKSFANVDINDLRTISDDIKKEHQNVILVLAAEAENKVTFMVSVTDDLLEKGYHAGNMIKKIAAAAGGGGGGKADMAQAGAKDPSKIAAAFEVAKSLL